MLRKIIFPAIIMLATFGNAYSDFSPTNSFIDPACLARQNTTSTGATTITNKRLSAPTFFELRIEIQKNLTNFLTTRIISHDLSSSGGGKSCPNPFTNSNCSITGFNNTDGTAITIDQLYQFVVYGTLYRYIAADVLDGNTLETLRTEFSKGYIDPQSPGYDVTFAQNASQTFDAKLKSIVGSLGLTDGINSLNNKSTADITTLVDTASTKIAESMSSDALFLQKFGYSSLVAFPITSRLMECLDGTFSNLFMRDIAGIKQTPFRIAQDYFKPVVILALILYFIAYGYKIMMAHGMGKQSEMFMFAIKFGLVFYFSIGEGWKEIGFNFLKSIPATVSQIMFEALPSSEDGCSVYTPQLYPSGKGILSFFDTIDCKYANYIGLPSGKSIPAIFSLITFPMLIPIPMVGLIISILSIVYLSLVTYGILAGIEIYISSIVFLTFYLFLSPIIVPMALFEKTSGIFTTFQGKIVGCVVQGVMAIVLIVTTIALMDGIIYGKDPVGNQLFVPPTQSYVNGIPQPKIMSKDCYPNSTVGVASSGGATLGKLSVVPMACHLAKIANEGVTWIGFPIPYIFTFFELPAPGVGLATLLIPLILPAIITVIMLFIINTVMSQTKAMIDKISNAENMGSFGAAKYSGAAALIEGGKKVAGEGKQAYDDVMKAFSSDKPK